MKRTALLIFLLSILSVMAFADGGIERKILPEEKAFYEATYRKIVDLMPESINDIQKKAGELSIPMTMGMGAEKRPIYFNISCDYRGEMTMQQSVEASSMLAADADGIEDMSEKLAGLSEEMQKAAESGDQKKILEIQAKMQAAVEGNAGMANIQKITGDLEKKSVRVTIAINGSGSDFYPYYVIPAPAGTSMAIRRDRKKSYDPETVLFFGSYTNKPYQETMAVYANVKQGQATKIHHMYIQLQGEHNACDELISKMNLSAFAALIR